MSINFINGMSSDEIQEELNKKILDKNIITEISNVAYSKDMFENKKNIFDVDDDTFITLKLFNEIKRDRFILCQINNVSQLEKTTEYNLNNYIINKINKDTISNNYKLKLLSVNINDTFTYDFEKFMFDFPIVFNNIKFFINEDGYFCLKLEDNKNLIFTDIKIEDKKTLLSITIFCK